MNYRRLRTLFLSLFPFLSLHFRGEERKRKRQNESGREAYKDVRPAPLDVRQRGTPELGFPFAEDVSLFRGNLFRACRSVRNELRSFRRADGGRVWLCQMPNFTSNAPFPLICRDDGRRRFPRRFFAVTELSFFYSYPLFLSFPFCLRTFRGRAEFQS